MCHQVMCEKCGRPTWSGCGNHVEQALGNVPMQDRCSCADDVASTSDGYNVVGGRRP
jgi:hypothetical protein